MAKAYIIVYDGTNVLIGIGGCSGPNKKERQGFHLPGGTIDGNNNANQTVLRELKEETGITLDEQNITNAINPINTPNVTFVLAKVESVEALVQAFSRPPIENGFDEPFKGLQSLKAADSWDNQNFSQEYLTDWFSYGLKAAREFI